MFGQRVHGSCLLVDDWHQQSALAIRPAPYGAAGTRLSNDSAMGKLPATSAAWLWHGLQQQVQLRHALHTRIRPALACPLPYQKT